MRNPKYTLLAAATFLALVAAISMGTARTATGQKGGPPVVDTRVVNTAAQPVPVTIQGTAQIDTASPIPVQDVDRAARQPFAMTRNVLFDEGERNAFARFGEVPPNKRLVIEAVSYHANVRAGQVADCDLRLTTSGNPIRYSVPPVFVRSLDLGSIDFHSFSAAATTRLYADPGTEVVGVFDRLHTENSADGYATISGYLVDL